MSHCWGLYLLDYTVTYCHRWELQFYTASVFGQTCFCIVCTHVSLCLPCTEIHSWVLFCQSRQFQIHHVFLIVSSHFYSALKTFGIVLSLSITPNTAHPHQSFSRFLSDPVHVVVSESKSWSSTGKTHCSFTTDTEEMDPKFWPFTPIEK